MEIGNFFPNPGFSVDLNGQTISMVPLGTFPLYTLYGGDVSGFANQTATLDITALPAQTPPGPNGVLLDNIVFSNQPIPEPGAFSLLGLGAVFLGWRFRRS